MKDSCDLFLGTPYGPGFLLQSLQEAGKGFSRQSLVQVLVRKDKIVDDFDFVLNSF